MAIRGFASIIDTLTSTFQGNQFDPLCYRAILKFKEEPLNYNKGDSNAIIKLSEDTFHEISW